VDVICLAGKSAGARKGVTLAEIPTPRYRGDRPARYVWTYIRFFSAAAWLAAKRSFTRPYDLVIVCSIPDIAVVTALVPRLFGSKVILDIHDTMPELCRDKFPGWPGAIGSHLLNFEERLSAWMANRVLAVHELHANRLTDSGIPRAKIGIVLNAPDPELFHPVEVGPGLNGRFTIITHGTINRRLGLDTALEAVNRLRERLPNLELRIIGNGEYLPSVRAHAERLSLEKNVSFENGVPLNDLLPVLAQASVGLVPNDATHATQLILPVKLLEFASIGIPVIASRLSTVRHYFPDDSVKYFTPGDAASLAAAIDDVYLNRQSLAALARNAAAVMKRLGWEIQRQLLFDAVDSALGRKEIRSAGPSA
jgi:glycosyltransferase involved in cell wall biosynthesis